MQDYTFRFYGCNDHTRLEVALARLAELAPAMVSADKLEYHPEYGLRGTLVVHFGTDYDDAMLPDPDEVAELVEDMNEETEALLDHQDAMREVYGPEYSLMGDFPCCECEGDEFAEGEDTDEDTDQADDQADDQAEEEQLFDDDEEIEYDEDDPTYPKEEADSLLKRLFDKMDNGQYVYITTTYSDDDDEGDTEEDELRKEAVDSTMRVIRKATGMDEAGVSKETIDAVENLVDQIMDFCEASPEDSETLLFSIKNTIDHLNGSMTQKQKDHCNKVSNDTAAKLKALLKVIGK